MIPLKRSEGRSNREGKKPVRSFDATRVTARVNGHSVGPPKEEDL